MKDLYTESRHLLETALPQLQPTLVEGLFARYFPRHLRVVGDGGRVASMLFSIPYAVQTERGTIPARYLFGIATDPAYRGQGLAKGLIEDEVKRGFPVFLHPRTPSLFAFYEKAGLLPLSPVVTEVGRAEAAPLPTLPQALTAGEYLACRRRYLTEPFAAPDEAFLSLCSDGALALPDECVALYRREGDKILFTEWLGNVDFAPRLAAYLGAERFELRRYAAKGTPFGVGTGLPADTAFLLSLM